MITIDQAKQIMSEAGYSAEEVAAASDYAERTGYGDAEEFFSRAMAHILYSADQLADCEERREWYGVEPGSLDDMLAPTMPTMAQ